MGDIVNLRSVRKAKLREAEAAEAEANRHRHGRTKAERAADEKDRAAAARVLDQARIDPD